LKIQYTVYFVEPCVGVFWLLYILNQNGYSVVRFNDTLQRKHSLQIDSKYVLIFHHVITY